MNREQRGEIRRAARASLGGPGGRLGEAEARALAGALEGAGLGPGEPFEDRRCIAWWERARGPSGGALLVFLGRPGAVGETSGHGLQWIGPVAFRRVAALTREKRQD